MKFRVYRVPGYAPSTLVRPWVIRFGPHILGSYRTGGEALAAFPGVARRFRDAQVAARALAELGEAHDA